MFGKRLDFEMRGKVFPRGANGAYIFDLSERGESLETCTIFEMANIGPSKSIPDRSHSRVKGHALFCSAVDFPPLHDPSDLSRERSGTVYGVFSFGEILEKLGLCPRSYICIVFLHQKLTSITSFSDNFSKQFHRFKSLSVLFLERKNVGEFEADNANFLLSTPSR